MTSQVSKTSTPIAQPVITPSLPSTTIPQPSHPKPARAKKHKIAKWLLEKGTYTAEIARNYGIKELKNYLKTPQRYVVATTGAIWCLPGSVILGGELGHHALIKLPGERICELGTTDESWKNKIKNVTDTEVRFATGKEIERMWRTHCDLIQKYRTWTTDTSTVEGWINYRPFTNDCFNYVNRILTLNNQKTTALHRLNQTEWGTWLETMLTAR